MGHCHEPCATARCRSPDTTPCLCGDGGIRARPDPVRRPKGTLPHRTIGWIWVALMALVAVSSFWIHQIRLVGPFSPILLLSIFTLAMLPFGVWFAHRHRVADHRRVMVLIFSRALVIAGLSRCYRGGSCTRSCSALEDRFPMQFSGPFPELNSGLIPGLGRKPIPAP